MPGAPREPPKNDCQFEVRRLGGNPLAKSSDEANGHDHLLLVLDRDAGDLGDAYCSAPAPCKKSSTTRSANSALGMKPAPAARQPLNG